MHSILISSKTPTSFPPTTQPQPCAKELIMNGTNGVNGHAAPPGLWQEARNPDGRVYYYNTINKATQWTKPEELMTPAEVIVLLTHIKLI